MGSAKKYYSFVVVALLLVGTVAAAFAYFRGFQNSPCQDSSYQVSPVLSTTYQVAYNNIIFNAVNATFHRQNQVVVIGDVTFRNLVQVDPSILRLEDQTCVMDNTQPVPLLLETSFQTDGSAEILQVQYGGTTTSEPRFTEHTNPQAGVSWYPGDTHLVLWARE